jgi:hypothetical protein
VWSAPRDRDVPETPRRSWEWSRKTFRTPVRFRVRFRRGAVVGVRHHIIPSFGSARVRGEARGRRLRRERASGRHAARAGGRGAGLVPSPGIAVDTARDDRRVFPRGRVR